MKKFIKFISAALIAAISASVFSLSILAVSDGPISNANDGARYTLTAPDEFAGSVYGFRLEVSGASKYKIDVRIKYGMNSRTISLTESSLRKLESKPIFPANATKMTLSIENKDVSSITVTACELLDKNGKAIAAVQGSSSSFAPVKPAETSAVKPVTLPAPVTTTKPASTTVSAVTIPATIAPPQPEYALGDVLNEFVLPF